SLDTDMASIVEKAMARERERRYQSAAELAADLERYEKRLPIHAKPATLAYRVKKAVRRRLPLVVGVSVALALLLAAGLFALSRSIVRARAVARLLAEAERP